MVREFQRVPARRGRERLDLAVPAAGDHNDTPNQAVAVTATTRLFVFAPLFKGGEVGLVLVEVHRLHQLHG